MTWWVSLFPDTNKDSVLKLKMFWGERVINGSTYVCGRKASKLSCTDMEGWWPRFPFLICSPKWTSLDQKYISQLWHNAIMPKIACGGGKIREKSFNGVESSSSHFGTIIGYVDVVNLFSGPLPDESPSESPTTYVMSFIWALSYIFLNRPNWCT